MEAAMSRNPTLGELLDTYKDLDAYIARGGKLLDLFILDGPSWKRFESVIADQLGETACARLLRFFLRIAALGKHTKVESAFTEAKLQAIWREAADDAPPTLH
jgi:hypothetical protein